MNIVRNFLIGLILLVIGSCRMCRDKEPQLRVEFIDSTGMDSPRYDHVQILSRDTEVSVAWPTWSLPLDPGADRVTFIFTGEERMDTLVVGYKIAHEYEGATCGFMAEASDIRTEYFSGIKNVRTYDQTVILVY